MAQLKVGDLVYVRGKLAQGVGVVFQTDDTDPEDQGRHRYRVIVWGTIHGGYNEGVVSYNDTDLAEGKLEYITSIDGIHERVDWARQDIGYDPIYDTAPHFDSVLKEAAYIVDGDREQTYGHPSLNFERTAVLWSVIFGHPVTLRQVALALVCLKLAREVHQHKRDNLVDAIGYLRCIEKMEGQDDGFDIDTGIPGFGYLDEFEKVHGIG